jgi:hypothetical protein
MMQLAAAAGEIVVKGAPILLAVEACGKGVMRLRFGGSAAVAAAPSYLPKAAWAGATAVAEPARRMLSRGRPVPPAFGREREAGAA